MFDSLGGCSLRTVIDGQRALTWRLDPTVVIDRKSNQLSILIYQEDCGATNSGKVVTSTVATKTALRISVTLVDSPVSVPSTASTCDGLLPRQVVLRLATPLGTRAIVNASDYPSHLAQPPEGRRLVTTPTTG